MAQHDGIGFRQRREQLQRLGRLAGAQQQVAERNGGVKVVFGGQAACVGVGGCYIPPRAFVAFRQQRQQPAALAGVGRPVNQCLKILPCLRVLALQRFGFQAAGRSIQRLTGAFHRVAGGQRLGVPGRQAFQRRQVQPALRMAGCAYQGCREHFSRRRKFMPSLLHGGLQHGQIGRRVRPVPPRGQRGLRAAPIPGVAGLPGHGNVFTGLQRSRRRIAGRLRGGRRRRCRRWSMARHGGQDFQNFIVLCGLDRCCRCGIELNRQQPTCQCHEFGNTVHRACFHRSGHSGAAGQPTSGHAAITPKFTKKKPGSR